MQKGIEINMYDLFRHVLRKWAIVLVFAVVFGIAANFYGYQRASLSAAREKRALEEYAAELGTTTDDLPKYMTAELAALREKLTQEEASFVEAIAKLYMYRMWASDKINQELIVGEPDQGDLEIVQTLYYANEGVESAVQVMTSAEKSYYNVLIKEQSGTDMSVTQKDISVPGKLQTKWIVIGVVLGAFLSVCGIAMAYVLSGKLRVAEDMSLVYGVPILASGNRNGEIDADALSKGIGRLLQEENVSKLAVCAVNSAKADAVCKSLSENLVKQGVEVKEIRTFSSAFVGEIADVDAALLIETVGTSRYQDIQNKVTALRNYAVSLIGCVVTE